MDHKELAQAVFPVLKSRVATASLKDGSVNLNADKYYNAIFSMKDKGVTIYLGETKARYIPMNKKGEFDYEKIVDRIILMNEEAIAISNEYNRRSLARQREENAANELNEQFKDVAHISASIHNDGTYTVHLKDLSGNMTKLRVVEFLEKYRARMKD